MPSRELGGGSSASSGHQGADQCSVTRESKHRIAGRASVGITKAGHQRDSTRHSAKV